MLDVPGEAVGGLQERALDAVAQARTDRDRMIADARKLVREAVLSAIATRVPVTAIAAELGVTRARIYQIRDGRR